MRRLGGCALLASTLACAACGDEVEPVDPNGPWQSPVHVVSDAAVEGEEAALAQDDDGRALLVFGSADASAVFFVARRADGTWGDAASLGDARRNATLAMNAAGVAFIALAAGDRIEVLRKAPDAAPELAAAVDEAPLPIGPRPSVVVAPNGAATIAWLGDGTVRAFRVDPVDGPAEVQTLATTDTIGGLPPAMCIDAQGRVLLLWVNEMTVVARRWDASWEDIVTVASTQVEPLSISLSCNSEGQALAAWTEAAEVVATAFEPSAGWGAPQRLAGLSIHPANSPSVGLDAMGDATLVFPDAALSMWAVRREGGSWGEPALIEARDGDVDRRPFTTARLAISQTGSVTAVWAQTDPPKGPNVVAVPHIFANHFIPGEGWGESLLLDQSGSKPSTRPVIAESRAGTLAAWEQFVWPSNELWVSSYER